LFESSGALRDALHSSWAAAQPPDAAEGFCSGGQNLGTILCRRFALMQNFVVCAIRFSLSFPAKILFFSIISLKIEHFFPATISHPAFASQMISHKHFQNLRDHQECTR
jgi:hypothetical protein